MICEPCKERVRTQQLSAGGKYDNFWGGWVVDLSFIAIKVDYIASSSFSDNP